jgi:hypothetical protein
MTVRHHISSFIGIVPMELITKSLLHYGGCHYDIGAAWVLHPKNKTVKLYRAANSDLHLSTDGEIYISDRWALFRLNRISL